MGDPHKSVMAHGIIHSATGKALEFKEMGTHQKSLPDEMNQPASRWVFRMTGVNRSRPALYGRC
jgi:hypothetical protein